MFKSILLILSFVGIQAFAATDTACNQAYGDYISQCAQGLKFLSANIRAGAQKACVEEAKIGKTQCLAGGGGGPNAVCLANCQAVYETTVNSCNTTYDPVHCGGSISCESQLTNLRAACISTAVSALDSCNLTCQ